MLQGIRRAKREKTTHMGKTVVSKTLGGSAERLSPASSSPSVRETASSIYHIIEGEGSTVINGQAFRWKRGDTFCIPSWHRYQHRNDVPEGETVYLYRYDDKPMLNALGFYRAERVDVETLVSA